MKQLLILVILFLQVIHLQSQTLAFPTAEGFGSYSNGGRGGDVYHVINLKDSGEGSLRYGIKSSHGPRTIVFDVSGYIRLKGSLKVNKDSITIAGQSAPGDGICLRDQPMYISGDHVIVRYIRMRFGDYSGRSSDALTITKGKNVIIDHCSAGWSVDEVLSCTTGEPYVLDSVTVQWCIISEALKKSAHSKGSHGYGSLIRGNFGAKYSFIHNLYAHNENRNPRPGNYSKYTEDSIGLLLEFTNNVIYNWGREAPGYDGDRKSVIRMNYVANYAKPGPDTEEYEYIYKTISKHFKTYFKDNFYNDGIPDDPWSIVLFHKEWLPSEIAKFKQSKPFSNGDIKVLSPQEAYYSVIDHAGASFSRDSVDKRIISDVVNGTGRIINSQKEVGGWPELFSFPAFIDTDQDGMPDEWEIKYGLDIQNPMDRNADDDGDGYTNLEEYLNELASRDVSLLHTLNVSGGTGGGRYIKDQTVDVIAESHDPSEVFDKWVGDTEYITDVNAIHAKILMPHKNVNVTASYTSGPAYKLIIENGSGDGSYGEGNVIDITADAPMPGKVFDKWQGDVSGISDILHKNASLSMPSKKIKINAVYKARDYSLEKIKINFQTAIYPTPKGYLADVGKAFDDRDNGNEYGWLGSDNNSTSERSPDTIGIYKTLIHLHYKKPYTWEIGLKNGLYNLFIVCGDIKYKDGINNLDVEGVVVNDSGNANTFDEYILTNVEVKDNRLTLKAGSGSENARICFIEIEYASVGE